MSNFNSFRFKLKKSKIKLSTLRRKKTLLSKKGKKLMRGMKIWRSKRKPKMRQTIRDWSLR
jgi:hypothetical protein